MNQTSKRNLFPPPPRPSPARGNSFKGLCCLSLPCGRRSLNDYGYPVNWIALHHIAGCLPIHASTTIPSRITADQSP